MSIRKAISRMRGRPDSEHEMAFNRVVFGPAVLLFVILASPTHAGLMMLGGYVAISVAVLIGLAFDQAARPGRRLAMMALDVATLSMVMHLDGATGAALSPLYLWIVLGNGFRFGIRYLFASAAFSIVAFSAMTITTPFWRELPALSLGLLAGLVILPTYAGTLIRKLSQATRDAEAANRAKSYFLASVSHELRTPLTAIIGLGEHLRDSKLAPAERESAGTIVTAGRSLLSLINQLLDFAQSQVKGKAADRTPFALAPLLESVRALLEHQAEQKGLRILIEVAEGTPAVLAGDAAHLRDILTNLVGNAVKFTDRGGVTVSAALEADGRMLRCEVRDTGIGIAQEAQARIFGSFEQADDSIIDRFGGTGLGLAICRQLTAMLGGEIGVESVPGEGSRFWFTAAVERVEEDGTDDEAAADVAAAPAPAARRGLDVLIADDNPMNRKVIGMMLARAGHRVTDAVDGEAALDLMRDGTFDAVLMDVNMPRMNGIDTTRLYRFAALGQRRVPIIGATADATEETRARCLEAGMDACVAKPIDSAALLAMLDELTAAGVEPAARPIHDPTGIVTPLFASVPVADAPPVLDPAALAELTQLGGRAFVDDLVAVYMDEAAATLAEARRAVAAGELQAFRDATHALRSSAANIGAMRLAEMCLTLQRIDPAGFRARGERSLARLDIALAEVGVALAGRGRGGRVAGVG